MAGHTSRHQPFPFALAFGIAAAAGFLLLIARVGLVSRSPATASVNEQQPRAGDTAVDAAVRRVVAHGDGTDWLALSTRDQLRAGMAIEQQLQCPTDGYEIRQFVTTFYMEARQQGDATQLARPVAEIAATAAALLQKPMQ